MQLSYLLTLSFHIKYFLIAYCTKNAHFTAGDPHQTFHLIQPYCNTNYYDINLYCGIGFRTINNEKCIQWKDSKWKDNNWLEEITFCKKKSYQWCATRYSNWNYCSYVHCRYSSSDNICLSNVSTMSTRSKIVFNFSSITNPNYVLIMNNEKTNKCFLYLICNQCDSIKQMKSNQFPNCFIKEEKQSKDLTIVNNLLPDHKYIFYLVTVFDSNTIGYIARLILKTIENVPNSPTNIIIQNITLTTIQLSWTESQETDIFEPAIGYILSIESNNKKTKELMTNQNNILLQNLTPCTNYSFYLWAFNDKGNSSSSKSISTFTKNNFDYVISLRITQQLNFSVMIEWYYNNSYRCPILYRVQYYIDNINEIVKFNLTRNMYINLTNLYPNAVFVVKVRPEIDKYFGSYSIEKRFFTGIIIPKIENFFIIKSKNQYDVKSEIIFNERIQNFLFVVVISDSKLNCILLIEYICETLYFNKSFINENERKYFKIFQSCRYKLKYFINTKISPLRLNTEIPIGTSINTKISNISIDLYSINLFGFHKGIVNNYKILLKNNIFQFLMIFYDIYFLILISIIILSILICISICIFKWNSFKNKNPIVYNINNIRNSILEDNAGELFGYDSGDRTIDSYLNDDEFKNLKENLIKEFKLLCQDAKRIKKMENRKSCFSKAFTNMALFSKYNDITFIPLTDEYDNLQYIISKDPNVSNIFKFFSMIWEQKISLIFMLRRNNYPNIGELQYWLENSSKCNQEWEKHFKLSISMTSEICNDIYIERQLLITHKINNEKRTIIQIQMHSWNEYYNPKPEILEVATFRMHELISSGFHPPVLVHCSSSLGRLYTFIVIDKIIKQLANKSFHIDVYQQVLELLKSPNIIVIQQTQYIFIHEFVKYFLNKYKTRESYIINYTEKEL